MGPETEQGSTDRSAIRIPFAAIVLAMLPAVLDQTILSTALPTIAADLGRLSDVSWVVTTYAVATVVGPLIGGLLVEHANWRWVFYVNLPLGVLAITGLRLRLPSIDIEPSRSKLDLAGAGLLAAATVSLMLACIWGGQRYAWD